MSIVRNLGRSPNNIDLLLQRQAGISRYRLKGHSNLSDAYGNVGGVGGAGTTTILDVLAGQHYVSREVRKKNVVHAENVGEQTRVIFDIEEFRTPTNGLPLDSQMLFLRVQDYSDAAGALRPEGPIYIIPRSDFYSVPNPMLAIYGKSPGLGATIMAGMYPPEDSLHIKLPAFSKSFTITNLNSSNSILFATSPGTPFFEVIGGETGSIHHGSVGELLIANPLPGTAVAFTITFEITNFGM